MRENLLQRVLRVADCCPNKPAHHVISIHVTNDLPNRYSHSHPYCFTNRLDTYSDPNACPELFTDVLVPNGLSHSGPNSIPPNVIPVCNADIILSHIRAFWSTHIVSSNNVPIRHPYDVDSNFTPNRVADNIPAIFQPHICAIVCHTNVGSKHVSHFIAIL